MQKTKKATKMKTKISQCQAVLNYMKANGGITTLDARDIGVLSLSRRICDLAEKGNIISKERVIVQSKRCGRVKIVLYILVKERKK